MFTANGSKFSFKGDEKFLKLHGGDCCTLNSALLNGDFYGMLVISQFFKTLKCLQHLYL